LQVEYSLAQREPERDLLPMARAFDIGVTAWSPLAGGILSGKYVKGTKTNSETGRFSGENNPPDERKLRIGEIVAQLANEIGRSSSQVTLNWLRQRKNVVIPIIGARRTAQIEDNLKSLDWQLTDEQLAKLDEATKIELGFPHDFLTNDFVRQMVFGGTHADIDDHRE
jgi:aryl-alcohol dehydrogenase-like predicted oxidoreductase